MIAGIRLHIEVGDAVIARCPRLWISSIRHMPLDIASIHIPDPQGNLAQGFNPGDPVRIEYGYRGGISARWEGTLRGFARVSRDQLCLLAESKARPLTTTVIRECYVDESSMAIARHLLGHSGLPIGRIALPNEAIPRFSVANITIWQAVKQLLHSLHTSCGHDMSRTALWFGRDGVNLGDFDEVGDVPVIASGENLVRHLPEDGPNALSVVESVLIPGLSHSRRFRLEDVRQGIDVEHRTQHVTHEITPGKIRTKILYGRERG